MGFRGLTLIPRQKRGAKRAGKRKSCSHKFAKRPERLSSCLRKQDDPAKAIAAGRTTRVDALRPASGVDNRTVQRGGRDDRRGGG